MLLTELSILNVDNSYHNHQVVKSLFEKDPRVLFCAAPGKLRVLSTTPAGGSCFDPSVKMISSKEVKVPEKGSTIPFKVLYYPKKSVKGRNKIGIVDNSIAESKFRETMKKAGVSINHMFMNFVGLPQVSKANGHVVVAPSFQVLGILTVEDKGLFEEALVHGVGSGKFAGWGMIDIF